MFGIFKTKDPDKIANSLTNQCMGGSNYLYENFRDNIVSQESSILGLEISYFSASVLTYLYLRYGNNNNPGEILDSMTVNVLTRSMSRFAQNTASEVVLQEYIDRYSLYSKELDNIFTKGNSSLLTNLFMDLFENVTKLEAGKYMIQMSFLSTLIGDFVADNIDFIETKL